MTLLVPTIVKQLIDYPGLSNYGLKSLKRVLTGAEPVPVTVIEAFHRLVPQTDLLQGYGLSEGPSIAAFLKKEEAIRKIGSAGKPTTNCEILIVDEFMNRVPPGEKGEIVIRSPATMKGYWNKSEATREVFAGGWMHTGDLAVWHPSNYIEIKDRKKDIIISGGENISSVEVEIALYKHPATLLAAVVSRPDEKWGETPCAFVQLKEGVTATEAEYIEWCRNNLARFKVPKRVVFGVIPTTATGKVQTYVLRERARGV